MVNLYEEVNIMRKISIKKNQKTKVNKVVFAGPRPCNGYKDECTPSSK